MVTGGAPPCCVVCGKGTVSVPLCWALKDSWLDAPVVPILGLCSLSVVPAHLALAARQLILIVLHSWSGLDENVFQCNTSITLFMTHPACQQGEWLQMSVS